MDPERLLTHMAILIGIAILSCWAFLNQNYFFLIAACILPFALMAAGRPDRLLMAVIILWPSKFTPYGLPGKLELVHLVGAFACVIVFLSIIINKNRIVLPRSIQLCFLAIGAQILITIFMTRNIGFAMLGSAYSGGMDYVKCGLAIAIAFLLSCIKLTEKQLNIALLGSILTAFLPAMAEALFLLTKGEVWLQYYFFQYDHQTTNQLLLRIADAQFRFKQFAGIGMPLIVFSVIFIRNAPLRYLLFFIAIGLTALSGYRIRSASLVLVIFLWEAFQHRKALLPFFAKAILVGGAAYMSLMAAFQWLPFTIQRSFSWLPFMPKNNTAIIDATASTHWRIEMWKQAVQDIPEHLLIGRGLTFPSILGSHHQLLANRGIENSADLYYQMGHFHNGPLNFIINLGLPSFVFVCLLNILAIKYYCRPLRWNWENQLLFRFYILQIILLITSFFNMLFLYGRPDSHLLGVAMSCVFLHSIMQSQSERSQPITLKQPNLPTTTTAMARPSY